MNKRTTFNVLFWINRSRLKDGKVSINARITVNHQKTNFAIKRAIPIDLWDQKNNRAKGSSVVSKEINRYLDIIKKKVIDAYQDLLLLNEEVTAETVKNKFLGIEENQQTLIGLCDYHNREMHDVLEWGTLKNYFTTRKYILLFLKTKHKVSDLH